MSHETSTASAKQILSSQQLALGILPLLGARKTLVSERLPMLILHGRAEGILHQQQGCSLQGHAGGAGTRWELVGSALGPCWDKGWQEGSWICSPRGLVCQKLARQAFVFLCSACYTVNI